MALIWCYFHQDGLKKVFRILQYALKTHHPKVTFVLYHRGLMEIGLKDVLWAPCFVVFLIKLVLCSWIWCAVVLEELLKWCCQVHLMVLLSWKWACRSVACCESGLECLLLLQNGLECVLLACVVACDGGVRPGFGYGCLDPYPYPNPGRSRKMPFSSKKTKSLENLGCHAFAEKSFFCRSHLILT